MLQSILDFVSSPGFIPHGVCLTWSPGLLWSMVGAHAVIALSYYSIPIALLLFLRRQPGLRFNWVFVMFSLFIFACGTTHLIAILNIWVPAYRLDGAVMMITAGLSAATAVMVWPLMPAASARLRQEAFSRQELSATNQQLNEALSLLESRNQQIAESERRFRQTFEGAPIGLAIVSLGGRWLGVNRALSLMLGYSEQELLSKTFQEVTHPDDLERDLEQMRDLIAGKATAYQMEKRYITRSGGQVQVQLNVSLMRDSSGKPLHIIAQIQDITQRKQTEQTLQRQNHEVTVLGELNSVLQSCIGLDEISIPVSQACRKLFPQSSGMAYLMNASRNHVESIASWGEPHAGQPLFAPDDCWSLRRGQPFTMRHADCDAIRCKHVGQSGLERASLCIPMSAQGELLGMLYLEFPEKLGLRDFEELRNDIERRGMLLVERISIAVANLKLREKLSYQSVRDPLTGLFNRRHLEDVLPRDLARAERENRGLAVMMIDVDHFKKFNDTYGHEAGDVALTSVARQIEMFCRQGDIACRYGGEEFAIVMPQVNEAQATARAQQLCDRLAGLEIVLRDKLLKTVTISVGVAMYPADGTTARNLIDAADRALYQAKSQGRNRVVLARSQAQERMLLPFNALGVKG